jgi:hypothetical protein
VADEQERSLNRVAPEGGAAIGELVVLDLDHVRAELTRSAHQSVAQAIVVQSRHRGGDATYRSSQNPESSTPG